MSPPLIRPRGQSLALVVFAPSGLRYLRCLKAGYRHCLVATQDGGQWHLLDPLSNVTEVSLLGPVHPDELIREFRERGLDAVAVQRRPPVAREMAVAPFTGGEAVRRVRGLRARRAVTPWQLGKALCRLGAPPVDAIARPNRSVTRQYEPKVRKVEKSC